ncbi:formyl peptide receptor-related sequence 4-like [Archocentrus centrarchus]|uniref:formyl peptide receptor-related sequence 4-like n=1 Tax=Archocentrus centrarchus TaxID=63155 RepID=UPI0011EA0E27|nr:formyl peptide receptor-related sequence 4-like [Archocentrus centrarchus]
MTAMTTNSFNQSNATPVPAENGTEKSDDSDWNKFHELFESFNIMSIVVFSLVSVIGVLGNGVVIWVTGFKMKTTVNTVWYLNLAVADFIFAAFLPLTVTSLVLESHWPFGKFMCKLSTTVTFLNMFASVYILVVISVDRCVSVMWPVWAQNHRNVHKASCVSLAGWAVALIVKAPYFFFMDTEQESADKIICYDTLFDFITRSHNMFRLQAIVIFHFFLGFGVPFTAIVSCYAVIIHRLRKSSALASQSSRSFKIITAIIGTFFLCWAPFHIMCLIELEIFTAETPSEILLYIFAVGMPLATNLAVLNSCINPLLYVFIRQDFKDQVRKSILNVLETAFQEEETRTLTAHQTEQIEL